MAHPDRHARSGTLRRTKGDRGPARPDHSTVSHPPAGPSTGDDVLVDAALRTSRRETYERRSALPVFVLGVLFLVGIIETTTAQGDTSSGLWLMGVAWVGFVVDLLIQWVLDDEPRSFPRRHWFAILAVLVPFFRVLLIAYVFLRLAGGRRRLQAKIQFYALYLTVLVVLFGGALVLSAERSYPGSNITTYGEAIWWSLVSVTTVGYGDYFPVSPTGRAIATLMLVNGVVIISVITATVSSRFVSNPDAGEEPVTLDDIDERLERIEAALGIIGSAKEPGSAPDPAPSDGTTAP